MLILKSDCEKPKNLKTFLTEATYYFQELFLNKFDFKSSWFEENNISLKGLITKKSRGDILAPIPRVK